MINKFIYLINYIDFKNNIVYDNNIFNNKLIKVNNYNKIYSLHNFIFYKIRSNDTLNNISIITNKKIKFLSKINNIKFPYILKENNYLKININYNLTNKILNFINYNFIIKLKKNDLYKNTIYNLFFIFKYNKLIKKFNWPVKNYNYKKYIILNEGILIYNFNSNIISTYKGIVIYSNKLSEKKYILIINHSNLYYSIYINNNKFIVNKNDIVSSKEVISNECNNNKFYFDIKYLNNNINQSFYIKLLK